MQSPICFRCGKKPSEIEEYRDLAAVEYPVEHDDDIGILVDSRYFIESEEGTYNPDTNTFCCTFCYIAIGCPSTPNGWRAPARMVQ